MRLTKTQAEYLRWLSINKVLRGRGANPACAKLRQLGLATIHWIGPREYAYTITRAGEAEARRQEAA
jgi:hypothetical protein